MKKNLPVCVFFIFLLLVITACTKTHTGRNCSAWVGEYSYNEDPVPTSTGINRIMEWELSVYQQHDTCWGILEVTGLRTYMKLLTMLSGDSSKVDVVYKKYLDGSQEFRENDILFSLSKDSSRITTIWNTLQPQLSEYAAAEDVCFRLKKKRKE
jgi:Family of unknown function (DUF5991)